MVARVEAKAVAADVRRLRPVEPWRWYIDGRTLAVALPEPYRVIGWAPLGGGLGRAELILNHQIELDDSAAMKSPRAYLSRFARARGSNSRRTVAMMTGANISRAGVATMRRRGLIVTAWCSAGCSNALRVGDPATIGNSGLGTINLIAAINQPLTDSALAEAIQIVVEARVVAVQNAQVVSVRSALPATGTGTDCVVVAARGSASRRTGARAIVYCGKHTVLGELLGRAALRSCARALSRCAI
jgi:adenosylcobinamide amidohydrolase